MRFFTNERPLGPNQTPDVFPEDFSEQDFRTLFDRENEIYRSLSRNPRILVGRRGSGKTAFLKSRQFINGHDICVELHSARAFAHVVRAVNDLMNHESIALAEDTAAVWNAIFSMVVFREIHINGLFADVPERATVSAYFKAIYGENQTDQFNLFLTTLVRELLEKTTGLRDVWSVIDFPRNDRGPSFSDAIRAAEACLKVHKKKVHILIDNLDDFRIDDFYMRNALTGLLKSIREFSDYSDQFDITFCIPAELFHLFQDELSSNPLKDFERRQLIQWSGKELIHLAANRYAHFLFLHEKDFYSRNLRNLDLNSTDDARHFWKVVFPDRIMNGRGREEDTMAYILRHTQLSPRHLIMLLNEVISFNIFQYGSRWNINNEAFIQGVRNVETLLCEEAFRGFFDRYPGAAALCEVVLPHLEHSFDYSHLHSVCNTYARGINGIEGFPDALRCLIEIGAIGLVDPKEETTRYSVGYFEYTLPNKLIVNSKDRLCVHPIFTERFRVSTDNYKPVYPYGCEIDGEEYRRWAS